MHARYMWELYAAWTWLPAFIAASVAARGAGAAGDSVASAVAFATLALSPETAVAVAASRLEATEARIAGVPEAFMVVIPPDVAPTATRPSQTPVQPQACPPGS